MKLTFTVKQLLILLSVFGLIFVLFMLSGRNHRLEVDRLNMSLYSTQNEVKASRITINNLEQQVYRSDAFVISTEKALKQSEEERETLKKLRIKDIQTISKLELEVSVLKKQGEYRDTIVITPDVGDEPWDEDEVIEPDTIQVASYKDEWAWANVLMYPDNPTFNFGLYETPLQVTVGYQGLLGNKPTVAVSTPNPYLNITKNNTIIVNENKKFLQRRYPYILFGGIISWVVFK